MVTIINGQCQGAAACPTFSCTEGTRRNPCSTWKGGRFWNVVAAPLVVIVPCLEKLLFGGRHRVSMDNGVQEEYCAEKAGAFRSARCNFVHGYALVNSESFGAAG